MSKCLFLVQHLRLVPYWDTILGHMHRVSQNMSLFYCFEYDVAIAHILGRKRCCSPFLGFIIFGSNNIYTLSVSVLL